MMKLLFFTLLRIPLRQDIHCYERPEKIFMAAVIFNQITEKFINFDILWFK